MLGHREVVGVIGTECRGDPGFGFVQGRQARRVHDAFLAVAPLRRDRIEPRTLDRQGAGHDPHRRLARLAPAVVGGDPAADLPADVPGGVVPDQGPCRRPDRGQFGAAPGQKRGGRPRCWDDRRPSATSAPRSGPPGRPATGPTARHRPRPAVRCVRPSAPPTAAAARSPSPRGTRRGPPAGQPGAPPGSHQPSPAKPRAQSGWVAARRIGRARALVFVRTPGRDRRSRSRRARVARLVAPLTRVVVSPSACALAAANASVHRLVGRIWARRKARAWDERRPAARAWRATSVSGRTHKGACMPPRRPHGQASSLRPH